MLTSLCKSQLYITDLWLNYLSMVFNITTWIDLSTKET